MPVKDKTTISTTKQVSAEIGIGQKTVNKVMMLSILQSQFIEKGFKKTQNSGHIVVLLLFLSMLDNKTSHRCLLLIPSD